MVHGIKSCWSKWYCNATSCQAGDKNSYPANHFWANYDLKMDILHNHAELSLGDNMSWPERANEIKAQIEDTFKRLTREANDSQFPPWFSHCPISMGGLVGRVLTGGENRDTALVNSLRKLYLLRDAQ